VPVGDLLAGELTASLVHLVGDVGDLPGISPASRYQVAVII
jgi:hypothetical protein